MTLLVIHHKPISRCTELGKRKKKKKEEKTDFTLALVYNSNMTLHDFFFCIGSHWACYPKAAYMTTKVTIF